MLTTLVAVAGLAFNFWSAQSAQAEMEKNRAQTESREQANKIQNQIRADKEELTAFVTKDKMSSVQAGFLIDDLRRLVEQLQNRATEEDGLTEHVSRIAWDLPYDQSKHFEFDVAALRRLEKYRQHWAWFPFAHRDFLSQKYFSRIEQLHRADPRCLEKVEYEPNSVHLTFKKVGKACNEGLIHAFMYGFGEHMNIINETKDSGLLTSELKELSRLTKNPAFEKRLMSFYSLSAK